MMQYRLPAKRGSAKKSAKMETGTLAGAGTPTRTSPPFTHAECRLSVRATHPPAPRLTSTKTLASSRTSSPRKFCPLSREAAPSATPDTRLRDPIKPLTTYSRSLSNTRTGTSVSRTTETSPTSARSKNSSSKPELCSTLHRIRNSSFTSSPGLKRKLSPSRSWKLCLCWKVRSPSSLSPNATSSPEGIQTGSALSTWLSSRSPRATSRKLPSMPIHSSALRLKPALSTSLEPSSCVR
mmetsp:Transcript_18634/g.33350  ORF Transcript_18634/g.33350 Transcript_18634/m.33350 type:complete len:238 (-) Transcript_18634:1091-1804(-)